MVTDDFVLEKVPDKYITRLLGTWSNFDYEYIFGDNGRYHITAKADDDYDWGYYYVISDFQIVLSRESALFEIKEYTWEEDGLELDSETMFG